MKLALRPDNRFGSERMGQSGKRTRNAVYCPGMATDELGWEELPGEGAFYAPKLEWHLKE